MQNLDAQLDRLDVRSLRILKHLLESRSVSRTAEFIGLSQPATSRIVAGLRRLTKDPLLVRIDNGYGLTPYATQLYPRVVVVLESIGAMVETGELDVGSIQATLRIASTDYGLVCVLTHLYPILLEHSPGVHLEVSNFTPHAFSLIEQGELDLALFADFDIPGAFHYRKLFEENYSLLVREEHPLTDGLDRNRGIRNDQLVGWPRAEMLYPSTNSMRSDDVIDVDSATGSSDVRFRLPYFLAAVTLIERTDTIIALPSRMCRHAEKHYAVRALPMSDSDNFTYVAIWHHRQHRRPLLRWLIDQIHALCKPGVGNIGIPG